MSENKRSFKEEIKDFWTEYGPKIKIGAKCLGVGLIFGFIKGVLTADKMNSDERMRLLDMVENPELKDQNEILVLEKVSDDDDCDPNVYADMDTGLIYSVECVGD